MRIGLMFALLLFTFGFLTASSEAIALPKNFRAVDVFYIGAMPTNKDMDELKALGVETVISLHRLPDDVRRHGQQIGLKLYSFPLRTRLLRVDEIMTILRTAPARTVYVHCLHGADRTGAIVAYWLSSVRNHDPFYALYTVISPTELHLNGLKQLGKEYGMCLAPQYDTTVGKYSGAKNGGLEGFKICGDKWYTKLARNYLDLTVGPPVLDRNDRFWKKYNKNE